MTQLPGRRFAWALVVAVLGALLAGAVGHALGLGYQDDSARPVAATASQEERPSAVVVVGVPGLSWADIDPTTTPTLDAWRAQGSTGVLVVRGAHPLTCAADGWLTLGAGQRAAADLPGPGDGCGPQTVELESGDGPAGSARIPPEQWAGWLQRTADRPLDAQLGALATAVEGAGGCVAAYGPLAALGAGDGEGRVARYEPADLTGWTGELAADCTVHLVDGATGLAGAAEIGSEGVDPAALDAELARVSSAWPQDTVVVVAGIADTATRQALRTVLVTGTPGPQGRLGSASTRQWGLVQTPDLTATVLALVGAPQPDAVAGRPVSTLAEGPEVRAGDDRDLERSGSIVQQLAGPVLGSAVAVLLLALLVATRRSRSAGAVVATVAQAVPVSSFLAGYLPWWRAGDGLLLPGLVLGAVILGWSVLVAAAAWAGPWRASPVGPPAVVAAVTVVVLCVDVMWGARLALTGLLGVQPVIAGRFYGMGNVGLGVTAASVLVLAAFLAATLGRGRSATAVVVALGLAVAVVDGSPSWGADFGGVPAVLVATGVLALAAAGVRLTPIRFLLIGLAAAALAGLLMFLDWLRPAERRTHLGAFAQDVVDGTAGEVVVRKLDNSIGILVHYPVAWVAVLVLVVAVWALARPGSPPGRVLEPLTRVPLLYAGAVAVVVCCVVGWALNDSGIAIVGVGLGVAVAAYLPVLLRAAPERGLDREPTRG